VLFKTIKEGGKKRGHNCLEREREKKQILKLFINRYEKVKIIPVTPSKKFLFSEESR